MKCQRPLRGLTLLELLVVTLIIAVLTTIATVTVTGLVTRARISATFGTIRSMEIAADRYEIDLGEYPVTSTGTNFGLGSALNPQNPATGCGYYTLSVLHSLSASAIAPLDDLWSGPYLEVETRILGDVTELNIAWGNQPAPLGSTLSFIGGSTAATQQILDGFGNPFRYVRSGPGVGSVADYVVFGGSEFPSGSPFSTTETYFNFGRFQIVSLGPDGLTATNAEGIIGLDNDDLTNFGQGL